MTLTARPAREDTCRLSPVAQGDRWELASGSRGSTAACTNGAAWCVARTRLSALLGDVGCRHSQGGRRHKWRMWTELVLSEAASAWEGSSSHGQSLAIVGPGLLRLPTALPVVPSPGARGGRPSAPPCLRSPSCLPAAHSVSTRVSMALPEVGIRPPPFLVLCVLSPRGTP